MIRSFANRETEDIYNGKSTKATRRVLPEVLEHVALRKLDQLDSVERLSDLRIPPGNRLELLKGERAGQYSIRINDQYRVCFEWTDDGPADVEIVDYH
ncbi:MAG TPA: type II toxin-antitoxin system RelE/ParE family toxin [Rhodothermia bacterium]|nr:type II toxin-antitoxin system RelE/ParE family toxin [Rhodothermia bacterium]